MKAYVIKNKEGNYFVDNYRWTNKLCNAYIFEFKKDAKQIKDICLLSKDCEPVKLTITEGDLEQQIRHQVCDEIREAFARRYENKSSDNMVLMGKVSITMHDILDKVEKENNNKRGK